jgi:spore coat protein U-like protein
MKLLADHSAGAVLRQPRNTLFASALTAIILGLAPGYGYADPIDCSVSSTGIDFGAYDAFQTTPAVQTGDITVTCGPKGLGKTDVNYTLELSQGYGGSFLNRQMKSGGNSLQYNLYADLSHTRVWGDGSGGSTTVSGTISFDFWELLFRVQKSATLTIYGQIPVQDPAVGIYSDSIVATVMF